MIKIIRERDTGKTKALLEICSNDPNGIYICKHPKNTLARCVSYGFKPVITYSYEDIDKLKELTDKNIYIDELDEFINRYIHLAGYCISDED